MTYSEVDQDCSLRPAAQKVSKLSVVVHACNSNYMGGIVGGSQSEASPGGKKHENLSENN
jgi:hypothetical protein